MTYQPFMKCNIGDLGKFMCKTIVFFKHENISILSR